MRYIIPQIEEFVNKLIENVVTLELDAAYLQKSVESRSVLWYTILVNDIAR